MKSSSQRLIKLVTHSRIIVDIIFTVIFIELKHNQLLLFPCYSTTAYHSSVCELVSLIQEGSFALQHDQ